MQSLAAKAFTIEALADQIARQRSNDDMVRTGKPLQSRGDVRRFPHHAGLLGSALSDKVPDDDEARVDTNSDGKIDMAAPFISATELADRTNDA